MPPRRPGTREELKERVLAKYGATNITDDDLAALMTLQPELDILFSQVRSFTNMSDGLRLTFAMRIGTQRTVVIVCATRLLRRRIKEILGAPVAERLLNHHGFMAIVIVDESIRNLHGPHKSHASLDPGPEAWGMSKLPDELTNRFARTGLGTLVSISSPRTLENRPPAFDVTIGGIVLMDGKLCGLTTAHGLGNMPTSDTPWEREPWTEGEDIHNIPPPAKLIAASSNSTDATPKDRQAWGGGGVCRGDWALIELPEDQILPNILSSHNDDPDDVLLD